MEVALTNCTAATTLRPRPTGRDASGNVPLPKHSRRRHCQGGTAVRRRAGWAQVLAVFLAALVSSAVPSVARAQDKDRDKRARATKLLIEGQKLHDAGEYAEALARFEKAYALVASPKIQFNFGLAYNGLDRPSDAIRAFQSFLAEAGDAAPANVAKAREYLARLNRKVGVLELDGDVSGAEVSVDGRSYAAA